MHGSQRPRSTQLPPPADQGVRIGDAERDRVIDQLADHHAAGRLTLGEFEDRMTSASAARTGADLAMLTADLPAPAPTRPGAQTGSGPGRRLDPAVRTYLAVMVLLWLIWLATGAGYPWPVWPMLGWGIGVVGHRRPCATRPPSYGPGGGASPR